MTMRRLPPNRKPTSFRPPAFVFEQEREAKGSSKGGQFTSSKSGGGGGDEPKKDAKPEKSGPKLSPKEQNAIDELFEVQSQLSAMEEAGDKEGIWEFTQKEREIVSALRDGGMDDDTMLAALDEKWKNGPDYGPAFPGDGGQKDQGEREKPADPKPSPKTLEDMNLSEQQVDQVKMLDAAIKAGSKYTPGLVKDSLLEQGMSEEDISTALAFVSGD